MRWLVVLVFLAGCERQGQPSLWRAPKVGDHGTAPQQFDATIEGPDGKSHTIENLMEMSSETLALDGDYPTRIRTTIVREERKFDGEARAGLRGTFEVTEKPDGALDVIRVDGTITPAERDFFTSSRHQSRATSLAAKRFAMRSFKVGEQIELTADEIAGFGFGMSSVHLTVVDVKPSALVFDIATVGKISDVGELKAKGTLRLSDGRQRDLEQSGEIFRDGRRIGTLKITQRSRVK